MMFMPTSNTQMRYKITCGAGTFDYRFDHAAMNRSEWNHLTLVSEGNDMHLYINSQLASSTRDAQGEVGDVVAPAKMGVTTTNYLGRSAWSSDPIQTTRSMNSPSTTVRSTTMRSSRYITAITCFLQWTESAMMLPCVFRDAMSL